MGYCEEEGHLCYAMASIGERYLRYTLDVECVFGVHFWMDSFICRIALGNCRDAESLVLCLFVLWLVWLAKVTYS